MGGAEEMNTIMINQDTEGRMEEETLCETRNTEKNNRGMVTGTERRDTCVENRECGTYVARTAYHSGRGKRGPRGDEIWRHNNARGQKHVKAVRFHSLHFRKTTALSICIFGDLYIGT